jgi:uncharacterized RDD family membrane protein YckC
MQSQYWPGYWQAVAAPAYEYASFKRRAAAYIIDSILIGVAIVVAQLVLNAATGIQLYDERRGSGSYSISFSGWGFYVPFIAYFVLMNARGATLAKRMFGIRVTNREGGAPGLQRALLRSVVLILTAAIGDLAALLVLGADAIGGWDWAFVTAGVGFGLWLLFSLLQLVDWLSMLWDQHNQTFHDQIGGTYVIRG